MQKTIDRSKMAARIAAVVAASLLAFGVSGCGGDAACEDAAAALCAKACSCGEKDCVISDKGANVYGGRSDCVESLQMSCGETGIEELADEDYDTCRADADKASCDDLGVEKPASCPF